MIELTPLKYFLSAYETGTFSQAARLNGVSQPTVSTAIQKMEDRLGSQLFQRSKAGLEPTAMATQLYHDAHESVAHLSSMQDRLSGTPQRTVKVHCAPDVLLGPFGTALNSLQRSNGELRLNFTEHLELSEIAFITEACAPADHEFIPLTTESFGIALDRHHSLAALKTVSFTDIQNEPIIQRPYCPHADRLDIAWPNRPLSPANAAHDQQLLELVAAGLGIAFVPFSHGNVHKGIVVRPLAGSEAETRTVGVSHRRSAFAANLARKLAATRL